MRLMHCTGLAMLLAATARADVVFDDAYIPEPPPGHGMAAGYATIINTSSDAITLAEVRTEAFETAELHETRLENGMSRMRPLPAIEIPAGGSFELKPRGPHLMLMGPRVSLSDGQQVTVEFCDREGTVFTADFLVKAR